MGVQGLKNGKDLVIYAGDIGKKQQERHLDPKAGDQEQVKNGSIFAGNIPGFGGNSGPMSARQELARKQARKLLSDTFASDAKLDQGIEEGRESQKALTKEAREADEQLKKIRSSQEDLKKTYGISDDSQEEKDLDLLRKSAKGEVLSEEEQERLAQMGDPTEYQKEAMAYDEQEAVWAQQAKDAKEGRKSIGIGIMETKIERLKSSPMADAQKEAAKIMEQASKDAVQSMMDQVKENMDEKQEEVNQKQEEIKEKKEEEKPKEKSEENPAAVEEELLKTVADKQADIDQELKKILQNNKVLEEDLKGLAVDAGV